MSSRSSRLSDKFGELSNRGHLIEFIHHDTGNPFIDTTCCSPMDMYEWTTENLEKLKADFILRGLRNPADFEFEKAIAHTNRRLSKIETVFLLTAAKTSYISSSIVRDVIRNEGQYEMLVPDAVRVK